MTTAEEIPETVVFDTEPLVAYFCDEPGSDTVETYIDAVMGSRRDTFRLLTLPKSTIL